MQLLSYEHDNSDPVKDEEDRLEKSTLEGSFDNEEGESTEGDLQTLL